MTRHLVAVSLFFLLCVASPMAQTQTQSVPPVAPTKDHREIRHDATVVDPYYWLRQKGSPDVVNYLKAENAYTEEMTAALKPLQDRLYAEMLARIQQTDLSVPVQDSGYFYYARTEEGKQYPIRCRRKGSMDAPEQVLLDLNQMAQGHKFVSVTAVSVSEDGNLLAYAVDFAGFRQYTLQIKDLRTGTTLADRVERVTSIAWAADNKTVFLTTEDAVTKRSDKLWRHTLGSGQVEAIYEEKDELFNLSLDKTRDKKYLVAQSESKDTSEIRMLRSDAPAESFAVLYPRQPKHRYYLEHRDGLFYIRTNRNGRNFEVVSVPDSKPDLNQAKIFLAQDPQVLVEDIDLFQNFLVAQEKTAAITRVRLYDFQTRLWTAIQFPDPVYSVFPGGTRDFGSTTFRYSYSSFVTPESVYDFDTRRGKSILLKRQPVLGHYDPGQYESERLWATARDGVKVPISIVYKKGFEKNGRGPLLLYGYGSYGYAMPDMFDSNRISLLDRGMAYAIAHIRGGNEMGEAWREDGMLMKKKNTFNDFVDCARYLEGEQWTSPGKLVIEGASAGGLLMGAVVNQAPELFRAVHLGVPFVDMMNTMMDPTLPLTVGEYLEWGNPNEKAAYDYMNSYSPYDNLEKRAYPAMLVTTSYNDSQVMYWEPAKYVARLRTLRTDNNPLLLKIKMDPAGHGGASGRYDRLHDIAFEYAWLLTQVGVSE